MSFINKFVKIYKALLPSPFTIAIVLSFFAFGVALLFGEGVENEFKPYTILTYWENGLWNNGLLVFTIQMMLMLVLGHVLALSNPVNNFIHRVTKHLNSTPKAAAIVTLLTILVAFFNWGLGLIFGAVLARKVGEEALKQNWKINYPLIGAAGYSGLMVWHGGFSGSSLSKVAEPGHLTSLADSSLELTNLPDSIDFSQTVFSSMNITISMALLIFVPLAMYWMGKRVKPTGYVLESKFISSNTELVTGAERLDHSRILGYFVGGIILTYVFYQMFWTLGFVHFFTPNNINLLLLGLGITFHQNLYYFVKAVDEAISGAAGILIQFPLYFGILGIMRDSELITQFSSFIASVSTPESFTFFTFFSAGIVNILIPSGGGQWAIQGPLLIETANEIGAPLAKNIMAFAYGDQITNMLQPFWALPLLGITGLKAKQILPFTLFILLISLPIFLLGLWLF